MQAIKIVDIRNFQSHEHTHIEFAGEGQLTVITGATDCGKTAIIRAVKWCLFNQPRGMDFMRAGSEFCQVAVTFTSGITVIRERRKSVNRYVLVLNDSERQTFDSFGDGVPIEIQRATGMSSTTIAEMELLLQLSEQLDGPFLGTKSTTGPLRAKIVGKLSGTEVVDKASREVARDLHNASMTLPRMEETFTALQQQIASYNWLGELEEIVRQLTQLRDYVITQDGKHKRLSQIRTDLKSLGDQAQQAIDTLTATDSVAQATDMIRSVETMQQRADQLRRICGDLSRAEAESCACEELIVRNLGADQALELVQWAEEAEERKKQLQTLRMRRDGIIFSQNQTQAALERLAGVMLAMQAIEEVGIRLTRQERLRRISATMANLHQEARAQRNLIQEAQEVAQHVIEQYTAELQRLGRCPTCGGQINADHVHEVI